MCMTLVSVLGAWEPSLRFAIDLNQPRHVRMSLDERVRVSYTECPVIGCYLRLHSLHLGVTIRAIT